VLLLSGVSIYAGVPDTITLKSGSRAKTQAGEYCFKTNTGYFCWKSGPIKDKDSKDNTPIPYYYELTVDYRAEITRFFSDPPPIELPYITDAKDERKRKEFLSLFKKFPKGKSKATLHKWDFVDYTETGLIIKKGYRWDGASRGASPDEKKGLDYATLLCDLRASFIHDVLYDLIRFKKIEQQKYCIKPCLDLNNNRELADCMYFLFAREDGHTTGLIPAWDVLRGGGCKNSCAKPDEKDKRWRFHTVADLSVSSRDNRMKIDAKGKKSITS
jgi:hypothetical protein